MRLQPILHNLVKIKGLLTNATVRECLIFAVFAAISFGFWLIKTLQETYDTEVGVAVVLTDVPPNVLITRPLPDTVYIKVRDRGNVLMKLKMDLRNRPLRISFNEFSTKQAVGAVSIDDLSKRLSTHTDNATALLAIRPSTMFFAYNRGVSRRVPVKTTNDVTTHPQYKLKSITVSPDTVTVYASQRQLDSLRCVNVALTECKDLRRDTDFVMQLPVVGNVKYVPNTVDVHIAVDMYTEKKVRVPITGVNFPAGKHLRTFPSTVEVVFRVGTQDYNKIKAEDFVLTVPYEELRAMPQGSRWHVHASSLPAGASNPRFMPADVEYLIEQSAVTE